MLLEKEKFKRLSPPQVSNLSVANMLLARSTVWEGAPNDKQWYRQLTICASEQCGRQAVNRVISGLQTHSINQSNDTNSGI